MGKGGEKGCDGERVGKRGVMGKGKGGEKGCDRKKGGEKGCDGKGWGKGV